MKDKHLDPLFLQTPTKKSPSRAKKHHLSPISSCPTKTSDLHGKIDTYTLRGDLRHGFLTDLTEIV
ncbi:hypothetical protein BREVNS_1749 [Brevinematales bacterium NS]|nr:hypothetical protein BREVNS_1749 [Brevinematales bacterium NS]